MEAAIDIGAGTVAGGFGVLIGQPLDVIRIRAQTTWASGSQSLRAKLVGMVRQEGVLAFYKGVVPPMIGVGAQHAALFLAYGTVVRSCQAGNGDKKRPPSMSCILAAGCAAGAFSSFVTGPVELLKVRQQVAESSVGGDMLSVARSVVATEGVSGLTKGLAGTILREVPAYGTFFVSYEYLKQRYAAQRGIDIDEVPLSVLFLAGGTSGVLSWLPSYPFDVVKSRIQVADAGQTLMQCATNIYRREGIQAFFRGFYLTIARSFPVDGAILAAFTLCLRKLHTVASGHA